MSPVPRIVSSVTPVTPGAPADKSQVGTSKAVANVPPSSSIGSYLANGLLRAYHYVLGITPVAPVAASPSPSTKAQTQVVSSLPVPPKKQPEFTGGRRGIQACVPLNAATTPTSGYSDVSPVSGSTNGGLIWTRRDKATGKNEIWYRRTTEQGLQPAGDDGIKIAELTGLGPLGKITKPQNIGVGTNNLVAFTEGTKLTISRIDLQSQPPVVTTSTMDSIDNYRVAIDSTGKVTLMTLSLGDIYLHVLDASNAEIGTPIRLPTGAGALTQLDISINTAGTQAAVSYVTGGNLVVHLAQLTPTGIGTVSRHTPAQGSGIGTGTAGSIGTYKIVMTETEAVIETATVSGGATEVKFGKYNMTGELQADIQVVPINGTTPISSVYKDQVLIVASTNEGNGQFKATTVLSKVAEGAAPQVAKDTMDYQTGLITQGNFVLVGDNATAGSKFYQFTPAGGQEIGDVPGLAPVALGVPNQISDDAAVFYKNINGTLLSCILRGEIKPFTTPIPPSNDTTTTTLTATTTSITMVTSSSTTTSSTQDPTQAPGSSSSSETSTVTIGIIIGGVVLLVAVVITVVVARRKSEARVDGGLDRGQVIIPMDTNPSATLHITAESEGLDMESFQAHADDVTPLASNEYRNAHGTLTRSDTPPAGRFVLDTLSVAPAAPKRGDAAAAFAAAVVRHPAPAAADVNFDETEPASPQQIEALKQQEIERYRGELSEAVAVLQSNKVDMTQLNHPAVIARYVDAAYSALLKYQYAMESNMRDTAKIKIFQETALTLLKPIKDLAPQNADSPLDKLVISLKLAWNALLSRDKDGKARSKELLARFLIQAEKAMNYSLNVMEIPSVKLEIEGYTHPEAQGGPADMPGSVPMAASSEPIYMKTKIANVTALLNDIPLTRNLAEVSTGLNHILELIPPNQTKNRSIRDIKAQVKEIIAHSFWEHLQATLNDLVQESAYTNGNLVVVRNLDMPESEKQAWLHIQSAVFKILEIAAEPRTKLSVPSSVAAVGFQRDGVQGLHCSTIVVSNLSPSTYKEHAAHCRVLIENALEAVAQQRVLTEVQDFITTEIARTNGTAYVDPKMTVRLQQESDASGNLLTNPAFIRYKGNFHNRGNVGFNELNAANLGTEVVRLDKPSQSVNLRLPNVITMEGPYYNATYNNLNRWRAEVLLPNAAQGKRTLAIGPTSEVTSRGISIKFTNYIGHDEHGQSYSLDYISAADKEALQAAGIDIQAIQLDAEKSTANVKYLTIRARIFTGEYEQTAEGTQDHAKPIYTGQVLNVIHLPNVMDCNPIDFTDPKNQDYIDMAWESHQSGDQVCIHCSAGIGRTGIFAFAEYLLTHQDQLRSLDSVLKGLADVREVRMGMIQVYSQLLSAVQLAFALKNRERQERLLSTLRLDGQQAEGEGDA